MADAEALLGSIDARFLDPVTAEYHSIPREARFLSGPEVSDLEVIDGLMYTVYTFAGAWELAQIRDIARKEIEPDHVCSARRASVLETGFRYREREEQQS